MSRIGFVLQAAALSALLACVRTPSSTPSTGALSAIALERVGHIEYIGSDSKARYASIEKVKAGDTNPQWIVLEKVSGATAYFPKITYMTANGDD